MSQLETGGDEKKGRRYHKRIDNHIAILKAARQVFSERGFGATTVRDIIRQTGLASGTFYNYFQGKEEIFQALIEDMGERLRLRLSQSRRQADTLEKSVEESFYAYFAFFAENPADYALVRSNRGREGGHVSGPQIRAGLDELRQDIQIYIRKNNLPQIDVDYLAAAATGIAFSILDVMMKRERPDPQQAAKFAATLALEGIDGLAEIK